MIIKHRDMPIHIKKLQCIAKRMSDFHPKKQLVDEELYKQIAGFKGEQSTDYYISYLDPPPLVLHNLRLKNGTFIFQIDTVLIYHKAIIILEIKNMIGTLELRSSYEQVIKTLNNETKAQKSFHTQVNMQKDNLERWIKREFKLKIPIIPLIIMSNPRTILKAESVELLKNVHPSSAIPFVVNDELAALSSKKYSLTQIRALANLMVASHEELDVDWFKRFDFSVSSLIKGISCPSCEQFTVKRRSTKCYCTNCSCEGFHIIEQAIEEAFMLLGEGIGNKELRKFLGDFSKQSITRIAIKANLQKTGVTKGTKYYRKNKILE
ncbi:nuclease-related domain-containing protein [Jeotgalibacillus salarius]|uniref:NERD domain-containing protein n=1 Tax=Jeotgalibacillus salarius TaxID=546023 RepID=A0A4Y8LMB4_9BACL|nr:nuclease-related domain-containing protein [Jeotgalibacillus salarius]TFE04086.1 NERD domain-containing protein [Jeotgalibacillus salarius]